MAWQEWIGTLSGWLYFVLVLACLLAAVFRRREPASALGWALAIAFVPVAGPLLFLLFGVNKVPGRLRRKIEHRERFRGRVPHQPGEKADYAADEWGALGRMIEGLGEAPRRSGNDVTLLTEGAEAFRSMSAAIEAARHHIHIEFYIFRFDDVGRRLVEHLERKLAEGVEVRVLVDAIGSFASWRLLRRLRRAGGAGALFLPIRLLGKFITPNLRNHRKIIVCDGRVAFLGGLNVGEEYLGRSRKLKAEWTDLHARLEGPAVWDVQRIFAEDWDFATEESLAGEAYFPPLDRACGDASVQVVAGGPDLEVNPVRQAFFLAFTRASRRILIATPYLVPDPALMEALASAARAGVEVDVITQAPFGDNFLAYLCGEYYTDALLAAGARVHHYTPGTLHAKALAVDGAWAALGSANLDNRSMFLNFEIVAFCDGAAEVEAVARRLEWMRARSRALEKDAVSGHPAHRRALISGARLLAPLL